MRDYSKLAPYLQGLHKDPEARIAYDLFAGALVWSDELPAPACFESGEFSPAELRGVWNFRSSLILGQPREDLRATWEAAQQAFPNWPGFDLSRRDRSLADTLAALEAAAMKKWEELDDKFNAASTEAPHKAAV